HATTASAPTPGTIWRALALAPRTPLPPTARATTAPGSPIWWGGSWGTRPSRATTAPGRSGATGTTPRWQRGTPHDRRRTPRSPGRAMRRAAAPAAPAQPVAAAGPPRREPAPRPQELADPPGHRPLRHRP